MGFTKDEATAAIRQITKGAERGALLTFLGSLNEQVLQSQLVSLEDDSAAIVACVQILQKQQGDHEGSRELIASMHGALKILLFNPILLSNKSMHTHPLHLLCLIFSILSVSSPLSRCFCLHAIVLSTRHSRHNPASDFHTLSHCSTLTFFRFLLQRQRQRH